jgi:hypothetical protein
MSAAAADPFTGPLWDDLDHAVEDLDHLYPDWFGPADLAAEGRIHKDIYRHVSIMLRGVEMLLRRLLIMAAASLTLAPLKPRARAGKSSAKKEFQLWDASTWSAPFRLFEPIAPLRRSYGSKIRARPPTLHEFERMKFGSEEYIRTKEILHSRARRPALGLARRLEAVARKLKDLPKAAKLAARSIERLQARAQRANQELAWRIDKFPFVKGHLWLHEEIYTADDAANAALDAKRNALRAPPAPDTS